MKRILLICLALTFVAFARPSLQLDKDRIEAGKTFGLQLVYPLNELPENRDNLTIETQNGFTFMGLDSSDQVIRPDIEDMFNSFFGGGRNRGGYKARIYTFKLRAPKKTGRIGIGQLFIDIDGQKRVIANDIPINIQRAFTDDALAVSLTASKKSVYEGEQFFVTLGLHTFEHFEGGLQATDMNTGDDFIVHRSDLSNLKFEPVENARREMQASAKFAWLSPTKSGNLQIPPFKFKYTKRGEPKIVEENSGMVGNYSFNADFDRTNLKVGEALTLSVEIKGDGTPGTLTDPKFPDFSDFRSVPPENNISKKIVGNKVITSKSIKVFLYPKKKGEFTVPEISYSWFNPSKRKYETATAGPWTIIVEKGEAAPEAIFQSPATVAGPPSVQKKEIESLGSDIRFIHQVSGTGNKTPYKSIWYWIALLGALPFYFIVTWAIRKRRKHNSDSALVRKGKANKMLRERFASAREALHKGDAKALYAALENGLIDYLSDCTNLEFKGMTRPQMKEELAKLGVKEETIASIDSWLEKCAFARFAPVDPSADEQKKMLADVEKLCGELGKLK